jgi:hypothetical protein
MRLPNPTSTVPLSSPLYFLWLTLGVTFFNAFNARSAGLQTSNTNTELRPVALPGTKLPQTKQKNPISTPAREVQVYVSPSQVAAALPAPTAASPAMAVAVVVIDLAYHDSDLFTRK